jgi:hypothetical protein
MMNREDEVPEPTAEKMHGHIENGPAIASDVPLPADIQATIARGEAAFKRQSRSVGIGASVPTIITSVVDQQVQDSRDLALDARELQSKGNRQQPPMIGRLRAVMILVDRLVSDGMRFGVGPNSKMNKAVHNWLNAKAEHSADTRKSRRKVITAGAVRELLKQVRALRDN